jgi:hypothetical protein
MSTDKDSRADKAFDWIVKIIDTCNNQFHFDGVDNLINLFSTIHPEQKDRVLQLQIMRQDKWNSVHNILF